MVTPLTPLEPELEPALEPELEPEFVAGDTAEEPLLVEPVEPELDVVTVGLLATVLTEDVVEEWLARAGS